MSLFTPCNSKKKIVKYSINIHSKLKSYTKGWDVIC